MRKTDVFDLPNQRLIGWVFWLGKGIPDSFFIRDMLKSLVGLVVGRLPAVIDRLAEVSFEGCRKPSSRGVDHWRGMPMLDYGLG